MKLPTMIIAVALLVLGGWGGSRLVFATATGGEHARTVSASLAERAQVPGHDQAESPAAPPADQAEAENEAVEPADDEAQPGVEATPEVEPTPEMEPTPTPPPPPAATPTPSASTSQTLRMVGGTVTLSCPSSGAVNVDSVMPNAGFTVEVGREDDDQTVEVRFESSSHESRLQADCMGGQVQVLEFREESS